ncbi:MAG: tetratricopeptide repeat-containing protein, partial [Parahaliea sp.]
HDPGPWGERQEIEIYAIIWRSGWVNIRCKSRVSFNCKSTGWAVSDAAGIAFAQQFYTHLFAGATFGEALRLAREHNWNHFREFNTWGAYQAYGDPGYRLVTGAGAAVCQQDCSYHAVEELLAELENFSQGLGAQSFAPGIHDNEQQLEDSKQRLQALLEGVPRAQMSAWAQRADVAAAIGFAWGELRDWRQALSWLHQALGAEQGDCPLRAVEQCANFRTRLAAERWAQAPDSLADDEREALRTDLVEQLSQAAGSLAALLERGETRERLNLMGAVYKRLVILSASADERAGALEKAAHDYERPYRKDDDPQGQTFNGNYYAFCNWATARALQYLSGATRTREDAGELAGIGIRMLAYLEARPVGNFWDAVASADCLLAMLLLEKKLDGVNCQERCQRIERGYLDAAQRGVSRREWSSVVENLDYIVALLEASQRRGVGALRKHLRALRDGLVFEG